MRKIIKLYEHKDHVFDVETGAYVDNPKTLALCDDGTVWNLDYTAEDELCWIKLPNIPQDEVMFGGVIEP